jgi:hypothetical protein
MKKNLVLFLCIYTIGLTSFARENKEITKKLKDAFTSEVFQLSGYGQVAGIISEHPNQGIASPATNSSFEIVNARIAASGKLGSQKQFGYLLMYDFGPTARLQELYGEWLPVDAINVRFGQYSIPFTIENQMSPSRIETVYFSRSVDAMSGGSGDFNQLTPDGIEGSGKAGRDAGLQVSGSLFKKDDFFRIEYYIGLFNGTGLNTKDNNNHKDFIGTVYYQPVKDLRIGGSVYSGKLNAPVNDGVEGNHGRNLWTVGAEYNSKKCYARTEYISGNNGGLKREGYYGSFVWKFSPDKWEGVVKYESYDKNKTVKNKSNEINDITIGVNYYLAYLTYIQLNYIYTDNKELGTTNNAVAVQLQLFF